MQCPNCSAQVFSNWFQCHACGKNLPSPKKCAGCHALSFSKESVCSACGGQLRSVRKTNFLPDDIIPCPQCGRYQEARKGFCEDCESALPPLTQCTGCGRKQVTGKAICGGCKKPLTAISWPKITCPACGSTQDPDNRPCTVCGFLLYCCERCGWQTREMDVACPNCGAELTGRREYVERAEYQKKSLLVLATVVSGTIAAFLIFLWLALAAKTFALGVLMTLATLFFGGWLALPYVKAPLRNRIRTAERMGRYAGILPHKEKHGRHYGRRAE